MGYWCGYLPGARCRIAYGPADATDTHCLLLNSEIQIVFAFLLPAHLDSPGKKAVKRGCKRGSINLTYANSYYYGLFPRTAWLSQYQKGKTSLHLNETRDDGVLGCSGMSWTICKQSAPCSIQITTPTPYLSHSFTDMLSCWQIAGNKIGRIQLYLQNSGVFAWSVFLQFLFSLQSLIASLSNEIPESSMVWQYRDVNIWLFVCVIVSRRNIQMPHSHCVI